MEGLTYSPRERFERLMRGFRSLGDEYIMMERAVEAFERYEKGVHEMKEKPEFKQVIGRAIDTEKKVLIKLMDELEEDEMIVR